MSNLTKIGIVIIFIGIVFLGIQFVDFSETGITGEYVKLTNAIQMNIKAEQTTLPSIKYYTEFKYRFLIEGKLSFRTKGIDVDFGSIYRRDGTVENKSIFIIKPSGKIEGMVEKSENTYMIELDNPTELRYRKFSISLNYDLINDIIYNSVRTPASIMNDILEKRGGITVTALKFVPSIASYFLGTVPFIGSCVLLGIGILLTVFGTIKKRREQITNIGKEIELEKELENMSINIEGQIDKKIHHYFKEINKRLSRLVKLNKDSPVNLSEVITLGKKLVNNSIKLAEYKLSFSKIKSLSDINVLKNELDELKIKYTNEHEYSLKIIILSQIKAKERVIFFLQNIDKKSEQIEKMIANVNALLEIAILAFPGIKKEIDSPSSGSMNNLKRKLRSEIEIQEKELEMLNIVIKNQSPIKKIDNK